MEANIVDLYYQRKKDNVTEYAKILIKSALDKKYMNVKLFQDIIENYMDEDPKNNVKAVYKVNRFLHKNNIDDLKLRKVINYTINFIDNDKVVSDIYENNDYIILISKILLLSLEINTRINIVANARVSFKNIVDSILEENTHIYDTEFLDKINGAKVELSEKIKFNIAADRKFFKTANNDRFSLDFYKMQSDFYNVKINYEIKSLKRYLTSDVNEQIIAKKLNFVFTIITAELLSILILKLLLLGNKKTLFFLKLPDNFIEDTNLLDKFIGNLNTPKIKMRVCLNIDYKSLLKNREVIENLKKIGFKIAIYDMNKLNHNAYLFKNTVDYLFLNDQLKNNSDDVIDFCNNNNLTFFEDSLESKEYVGVDYLLKH